MLLFKHAGWRKWIVPFVLVMGINLSNVPIAQASECSWWDILSLGTTCLVKLAVNRLGESHGRGLAQGVKPAFNEMADETGKKLAAHLTNSVDWKQIGKQLGDGASEMVLKALDTMDWQKYGQQLAVGFRAEFEATMDKLFDEKIRPLLDDIDKVLQNRLEQADKMAEDRLNQLDNIIGEKLKQADAIIQNTFKQFEKTIDNTIKKVRTQLVDYARIQATEWRDESIEKVRTELIDYAHQSLKKATDEVVKKVRQEVIDYSFDKVERLRETFKADMADFFKEARELIVRLECAEEKTRLDIEAAIRQLDQLGEKYVREIKNITSWRKSKPPKTVSIPVNLEACYKEAGIDTSHIDFIHGFEYLTIYEIKKCKVLSTLNTETPVKRIANVYWDLYKFAQRVACFQGNTEHFVWDLLTFKYEYEYWSAAKYY